MLFGRHPLSTRPFMTETRLWVPFGLPEHFDARDESGPLYFANAHEMTSRSPYAVRDESGPFYFVDARERAVPPTEEKDKPQ